jgi:hypothetical protein
LDLDGAAGVRGPQRCAVDGATAESVERVSVVVGRGDVHHVAGDRRFGDDRRTHRGLPLRDAVVGSEVVDGAALVAT